MPLLVFMLLLVFQSTHTPTHTHTLAGLKGSWWPCFRIRRKSRAAICDRAAAFFSGSTRVTSEGSNYQR